MSFTLIDILLALLIGILTGFVLQRGRVCSNTAFRNLFFIRNSEIASILLYTITIELIGYQILFLLFESTYQSQPIPFNIILLPLGAFIFGIGTVIAGGCAGGVCYRIGEGSSKSLLSFIGFGMGVGFLAIDPLKTVLSDIRLNTDWLINEQIPSLEIILPRWSWTIIAMIMAFIIFTKSRNRTSDLIHLRRNWTPVLTGTLLGFLGIAARITSTQTGRVFGFSTTDGIGEIFQFLASLLNLVSTNEIGWAGFFITGLIIGSLVSSIEGKEFKLKIPNKRDTIRFFGGGLLLGSGAMLAMGCNFGHILGGIPELGISSILATLLMILGNWVGSYILYVQLSSKLPTSTPKTG